MLNIFKNQSNAYRNIEYELERYSALDEVAIYRLKDNNNLLDEELEYMCGDLVIDEYFDSKKVKHNMRTLFEHSGNLFQIDPVYNSDMFIRDCLNIKESSSKEGSNSFSFEVPCIFFNEFKVICVRAYYSLNNNMYYLVIRKLPYVSKYMGNMYDRILHDCVSGLYTKIVALKDLSELELKKGDFLVFIDIDNFKHVNDEYGHIKGDEVLNRLGQATTDIKLEDDGIVWAYRFGGDEFLVVARNTTSDNVLHYLKNVQHQFEKSVDINNEMTFSAGIVEINPNLGNYENIILCADTAMYEAKNSYDNYFFMSNDKALEIIKKQEN